MYGCETSRLPPMVPWVHMTLDTAPGLVLTLR